MNTKNEYGLEVKMCCASCTYKKLTRAYSQRWCEKHKKTVSPLEVCPKWEMNKTLKKIHIN